MMPKMTTWTKYHIGLIAVSVAELAIIAAKIGGAL